MQQVLKSLFLHLMFPFFKKKNHLSAVLDIVPKIFVSQKASQKTIKHAFLYFVL